MSAIAPGIGAGGAAQAAPGAGGYLLLRRGGSCWGVASGEVAGLARRGGVYRLEVAGHALAADEILGVVGGLEVRPLARVLRRFWPEAAGGWAVSGRLPVVVVDPRRPPRALRDLDTLAADPAEDAEEGDLDGD